MDASTISTILPPFVAAMLETADQVDVRTPIGGTEGEDLAVLFRVGAAIGAVSSQGNLEWAVMDSAEEAVEQFDREHAHADRLCAYAEDPNHDPRVLMVVVQRNIGIDEARQLVAQFDAMRAMASRQEQEPASAEPVRAIGRAAVPTGTAYQVAAEQPHTGMYL